MPPRRQQRPPKKSCGIVVRPRAVLYISILAGVAIVVCHHACLSGSQYAAKGEGGGGMRSTIPLPGDGTTYDSAGGSGEDLISAEEEAREEDGRRRAGPILPNVLVIGAREAGAASIADWLFSNDNVCRPMTFGGDPDYFDTEAHFFDDEDRYSQGLEFYARRFEHCATNRTKGDVTSGIVMDATPDYLEHAHRASDTYRRTGGDAHSGLRLLLALREPIAREHSLYDLKRKQYAQNPDSNEWFGDIAFAENGTVMTFEQYSDLVLKDQVSNPSLRQTGKYVDHARQWVVSFSRGQLLVISHDELLRDASKVQWRIQEFLRTAGVVLSGTLLKPQGRGRKRTVPRSAVDVLGPSFERKNRELYRFLDVYEGPAMEQRPFPRFEVSIESEDNMNRMILPNVLLIGVQKASMTSIADWLFKTDVCRPEIFDDEPYYYDKEAQFFNERDRHKRGIEFYAKRFQHCADEENLQFVMDATPEYILYPERVYETYSEAPGDLLSTLKLMVILREPISQEGSRYSHMRREFMATNNTQTWFSEVAFANGTVMSFDQYAENVLKHNIFKDDWKWPGRYVEHLRSWERLFGRDRLLVLSYDELLKDPKKVQWRVREFLGGKFRGELSQLNTGGEKSVSISDSVKRSLGSKFASKNKELYQFLDAHKGPWMEERPFRRFKGYEEFSVKGTEGSHKITFPNVLLIGAQKASTTSIADWLFKANVCRPQTFDDEPFYYDKEVHFFDELDRHKQGVEFYAKRFRHCTGDGDSNLRLVMDATPNTLLYPERVHEMYRQAPGDSLSTLKLMVILREPVSRERSRYDHMRREFVATNDTQAWFGEVAFANGTVMSFDQYADIVLKPNIFREDWKWPGRYVEHLRTWVHLFGRDKLLVLSYDELQQDPKKVQWRIEKFLGGKFPGELSQLNTGAKSIVSISDSVKRALGPKFASKNEELYQFLDARKGPWMEEHPFRRFDNYYGEEKLSSGSAD